MEHTKTPWQVGSYARIIMDDGVMIARIVNGEKSSPVSHDKARLIVNCVNAHDALVAALEKLYAMGEKQRTVYPADGKEVGNAYSAARAALKLARGE